MTSTYELMWMVVVLCGESGMRTWSIVLMWVAVNTVWSRLEMWMWFDLEIRKWRLRGSEFVFGMRKSNTWLGSVALRSQLFQFYLHRNTSDWILAVGSFGGHRRAVTAGHRRGPGGG